MAFTVNIDENEGIDVQSNETEVRPPDTLQFFVAGRIEGVGEEVLAEFSGRTMRPTTLTFENGESVGVDLTRDAELELTGADASVERPDVDGPSLGDGTEGEFDFDDPDVSPAVEFSVTGVVEGVDEATIAAVDESSLALSAVAFEAEDPAVADGGADDAVLELGLLGFSIRVFADGSLTVASPT